MYQPCNVTVSSRMDELACSYCARAGLLRCAGGDLQRCPIYAAFLFERPSCEIGPRSDNWFCLEAFLQLHET